jgi:hypothetical protein
MGEREVLRKQAAKAEAEQRRKTEKGLRREQSARFNEEATSNLEEIRRKSYKPGHGYPRYLTTHSATSHKPQARMLQWTRLAFLRSWNFSARAERN